ncbi:hypothetical protein, variant [Aphanomyces invadans]|nr:hypothetical protein, variant [Aphanomyces invadans]ETV97204.1 hypothetical protein, variant [Aphanomyces invadans]|eukprot:XP_008874450.1 hypothetical protein, variant [Aphanomyces invadans]
MPDTSKPILSVELWDCSKSYDEFVCVAQRPCDCAFPPTWWALPRQKNYRQPELLISVTIEMAPAPSPPTKLPPSLDFTFRVPCDCINWRALNAVNVGAVVHKKQVDVLEGLMDVTLCGDANTEDGNELASAMVLLQFACQYADYCKNQLTRRVMALQDQLNKHTATKEALVRRRRRLDEKNRISLQENHALDDRLASLKAVVHQDKAPLDL